MNITSQEARRQQKLRNSRNPRKTTQQKFIKLLSQRRMSPVLFQSGQSLEKYSIHNKKYNKQRIIKLF